MPGMLDFLLRNTLNGPKAGMLAAAPGAQWPEFAGTAPADVAPAAGDQPDESGLTQDAAERAAKRVKRGVIHRWSPNALAFEPNDPAQPSQNPADYAGLVSAFGSDRPATNDPMSGEPQVEVPLPRPRPEGIDPAPGAPLSLAPQDYQDKLPAAAVPAQGQASTAPAAPGFNPMGMLGKLLDPNKAATLLALGGGFAGAPSFGTGMRRAFSNAVPAMAADRAQGQKTQTIQDTYNALRAKGVPAAEALAASQNPEIMKATAAKYFETKPRVPHAIGTDLNGNPIMGSFDPNNGKFYNAAGIEIGGGQGGGGGGDATGGSGGLTAGGVDVGGGMLAKGVTEINQELPAQEYLAQFSPTVKAQIENYINGDTMPTGNPRLKGSAARVKEFAQTYGSKAGIPVSDATFSSKRTMQNQIASSAPNSMGGILSNGKSAFGHLANLGENFADLGNRSGPDVPGGAHVGRAANYVGNAIAPTPETAGKLAAVRDNAGKYGAEATKFYAGTGGGVEERLSALHETSAPGTLATEQAAYLKTEKNLMLERISQKEAQIREVMGDDWLQKHPIRTPDLQHAIDRIDKSITKLTTGGGAAPAAPGVNRTGSGVQWRVVQ